MPSQTESRVQLRSNREIAIHVRDLACTLRFAGAQPVPYFEDPFGFVFDIIERPAKIIA